VKIKPADLFELQLKDEKIEYQKEVKFHPIRKWRFDYTIESHKLAIEIMGGIWTGGGHVTGMGYEKDCEKLNNGVILGWRVMYITSKMVRDGSGIEYVKQILRND